MKIVTTYTTNAQGKSQILAKANGKQKTTGYDPSQSSAWNHGNAAAEFLLAKDGDDPILLAREDWQHDSNDSGSVHTFTF